ncbi:hypothetical protein [Flavobacterium soyangense]|uniref:Oxidase n=1 Tax=Flavobacterium soyangense TaxID=2023265 RepID=A0A930UAZ2_9FLAO|nr:hypothetical protein [Flavobacterium soyangense]MBF2708787.1 hypothetical protein [Flavobacterium soyangense]
MTDILLTTDFDLKIANGDFVTGDSSDQNVEQLFMSTPGDWKEHLEIGIAITRASKGNIDRFLDRTIHVQMAADGYNIKKLAITETGVSIDGRYD